MAKVLTVKDYVESYRRSSDRTRGVYYLIVAVSILVVIAFLNTRPNGWIQSRVRTLGEISQTLAKSSQIDVVGKDGKSTKRAIDPFLEPHPDRKVVELVSTLADNHIYSKEQLKSRLDNAEKTLSDSKLIQAPILGFKFDANDLGLISGISLLILTILLNFYVTREYQNLRIALWKARTEGEVLDTYQLLSMSEVIHTPPGMDLRGHDPKAPKINLAYPLAFVPSIAYGVIFGFDLATSQVGIMLNPNYTRFILTFEAILTALLIFTAVLTCGRLRSTGTVWQDGYDQALAEFQPPKEPTPPDDERGAVGIPVSAARIEPEDEQLQVRAN